MKKICILLAFVFSLFFIATKLNGQKTLNVTIINVPLSTSSKTTKIISLLDKDGKLYVDKINRRTFRARVLMTNKYYKNSNFSVSPPYPIEIEAFKSKKITLQFSNGKSRKIKSKKLQIFIMGYEVQDTTRVDTIVIDPNPREVDFEHKIWDFEQKLIGTKKQIEADLASNPDNPYLLQERDSIDVLITEVRILKDAYYAIKENIKNRELTLYENKLDDIMKRFNTRGRTPVEPLVFSDSTYSYFKPGEYTPNTTSLGLFVNQIIQANVDKFSTIELATYGFCDSLPVSQAQVENYKKALGKEFLLPPDYDGNLLLSILRARAILFYLKEALEKKGFKVVGAFEGRGSVCPPNVKHCKTQNCPGWRVVRAFYNFK